MSAEDDRPAPAGQPRPGAPRGRRGTRELWRAFLDSPFLPAAVVILLVSAGAGLFAGSYTYSMANPTPRRIPAAVVGPADTARARAFETGMERSLGASLELHPYPDVAAADRAVEDQKVFAVIRFRGGGVRLDVASAAGASVAQLLATTAPRVAHTIGMPLTLGELKPLQKGDPRGLAIFYISLASVIVGFIGAIQLSVHARGLGRLERLLAIVTYALLGGFTIAAVVDWLLGALRLPFVQSWLTLSLTMYTAGLVFAMFDTLFGRWAMLPTWGLLVLLGNPSSGGAVSWPLLPSVLGRIGRWLPPGASVNAQHTAVYFGSSQHAFPYLVLAGWALPATLVYWVSHGRRSRDGEVPAAVGS